MAMQLSAQCSSDAEPIFVNVFPSTRKLSVSRKKYIGAAVQSTAGVVVAVDVRVELAVTVAVVTGVCDAVVNGVCDTVVVAVDSSVVVGVVEDVHVPSWYSLSPVRAP